MARAALGAFGAIPDPEWQRAVASIPIHHLHLEKGAYFIRTGDVPRRMAFIVSGLFRVFYTTGTGHEKVLVFREEGRMLSAFSAYLEGTTSSYDIQALEDSDLLCISLADYATTVGRSACWRAVSARYAEMLVVEKERREKELLSDDAETRYLRFLDRHPGIEGRIQQYHIASYLGITPVALSRIRSRLRRTSRSSGGEHA